MIDKNGSASPLKIIIVVALVFIGLIVAFVVLGLAKSALFIGGEPPIPIDPIINTYEQQILDDLNNNNKKISTPSNQISLNKNEEHKFMYGVKNIENSPLELQTSFRITSDLNEIVQTVNKIVWDDSVYTLEPNEAKILSATITASNLPRRYLYEIIINNGDSEYTSKTFFVIVEE
jgi:hypothetical protein